MTTYVQARDAIVAHIDAALTAAHPTLPVFYENTTEVDTDTVASPFLRVAIDFDDSLQLTVNDLPEHQVIGEVGFEVWCREGQGTRTGLALFDYLTTLMKYKALAGVKTLVPAPGRKFSKDGWARAALNVPFHFDSLS